MVVVGAGFAGLYAARSLARLPVRVTVVDRRNHHLFQPLLYQVATAALSAPDVAAPIRRVLRRQANTTVYLAEATGVDPGRRLVRLRDGEIGYDYLILAAGAENHYFGHPEWQRHAPGLKALDDALDVRRRMLIAFEAAERETDPARRSAWLTFVVVGGGPTGVELAGAIREIAMRTLARDFRNFDSRETRVILMDAAPRILPAFPEGLSRRATRMLESRAVEVRTGVLATEIDATGVAIGEERIRAATVLWAAGVSSSPLAGTLGADCDRQGRVRVASDLSLPGHPEVFAIGDLARVEQEGEPLPGMAPPAIQEGRHAAAMIARDLRGEERSPFRYRDRGMLATVGRRSAVAKLGRIQLGGPLAWALWIVVHIAWLIGFRNRLVVLFEWAWAYFTYQRSARVIFETSSRGGRRAERRDEETTP